MSYLTVWLSCDLGNSERKAVSMASPRFYCMGQRKEPGFGLACWGNWGSVGVEISCQQKTFAECGCSSTRKIPEGVYWV